MILPHTFEEGNHVYRTDGRYCLSTSDIIDLLGISDFAQIPRHILRNAEFRGKCLHAAIENYEQGMEWQDDFPQEFMPYLDGWFAFRDAYQVQLVGPHEKRYVYLHELTDQAIGGTVDFRFLYKGKLYIGDLKSIHPVSGKKLEQKKLEWRLQGESYKTATYMDEPFMKSVEFSGPIERAIVHIHPKLKGGYQFHEFTMDDSDLWTAAVRVAMSKIAVGILPDRRNVDVREMLEASCA